MDGKGYPRGLKREQMSVQARCMGIADIFEALTAKDRPYKKGKTLTEALTILGKFKLNGHIDPDLFDVFMWEKVYEQLRQAVSRSGPDRRGRRDQDSGVRAAAGALVVRLRPSCELSSANGLQASQKMRAKPRCGFPRSMRRSMIRSSSARCSLSCAERSTREQTSNPTK